MSQGKHSQVIEIFRFTYNYLPYELLCPNLLITIKPQVGERGKKWGCSEIRETIHL
jgi:hypothetical protein